MNPTLADWRAQVEKELAGASPSATFEKLVARTPEGLAIQPLYTERVDSGLPGVAPFARGASIAAKPFEVCMRAGGPDAVTDDLAGGADALWLASGDRAALAAALGHKLAVVMDFTGTPLIEHFKAVMHARSAWLGFDPIDEVWRNDLSETALQRRLAELGGFVEKVAHQRLRGTLGAQGHHVRAIRVSSLEFHAAGADAADEIALVLSKAVAYLKACVREGVALDEAARSLWVQVAVGRDTFGELCKLRALRIVWWKMLAAAGVADARLDALHAVCSSRTQSVRDPWVNMLRVTTEVFAAVLGGAQLVTPTSFDDAFGVTSPLGRRTARNTALVLREESQLGKVLDAGGGSYYLEARTDALAREVWSRFRAFEAAGGMVANIGKLGQRLTQAWAARATAIAKRIELVLGVSEFANLDETLPAPLPIASPTSAPRHRDGEEFEALRAHIENSRDVVLVTLGPSSEHRGRVGYAQALFATVGLRSHVSAEVAPPPASNAIACICGSDERYVVEAEAVAAKLKEAGYKHIAVAGRPGALERKLRTAGINTFVFMGCDVIANLNDLLSRDP
ncbi:MAG TPA: methylmalonyl-CoA mutase family protein [Kofleriaceae bacterium]